MNNKIAKILSILIGIETMLIVVCLFMWTDVISPWAYQDPWLYIGIVYLLIIGGFAGYDCLYKYFKL